MTLPSLRARCEMATAITGLRADNRQLLALVDGLAGALEFYGDKRRYEGSNQRLTVPDKYTPVGAVYLQDVARDNGEIARAALAQVEQK